ncbi:probable ubiquitin carboxyl-terminal hydrolase MINDY-4 isoform X2 [Ictalurus furcatus]|uniref:probable ubiquitin carboxyl-terminal hydrolase MINDY-4 isoform X2 n=1 Tax=Ictalurus furcatus TaxID=66913 RepID=UPI0023507B75|nr:probable ubiquitin carboxyl-terminal hydrolase MINDY-4 isoform X2 [Ictalurus furcatus]
MGRDVEEVAAAVVREYLSRKGLKKTIACMDEEFPRTNSSINNRSELCRVLHLESLYKKNKSEDRPLKTMLEIMTKERMKKAGDVKKHPVEGDGSAERTASKPGSDSAADEDRVTRGRDLAQPHTDEMRSSETSAVSRLGSSSPPEIEGNLNTMSPTAGPGLEQTLRGGDGQTSRGSRMRRGIMAGPIAASSKENARRRGPVRKTAASPSLLPKNEEEDSSGLNRRNWSSSTTGASHTGSDELNALERESTPSIRQSGQSDRTPRLRAHKNDWAPSPRPDALHMAGLVLDDVDDREVSTGLPAVPIDIFSRHRDWNKCPMDQKTAIALKEIIFGSPAACFSEEWRCQSFTFSSRPALRYGIVQKKGGPCGVLAAVQAAVLQKLLFEGTSTDALSERLSDATRTKCLTDAVAGILWRAADRKNVTVAINSGRSQFTPMGHYRFDGVLDMITCVDVQSFDDLKLLIAQHIHQFESGPFGCVLLIVSAVLSRTIHTVRGDMDVPTSTLIGAHGYCTQELVNLLLCGRAVSNVFDDEMKLDSGNGNFTLLKGIKERCDFGLLSLYEHYNICKVGSYLKNPRFPIWVVCSESHFSVLFSPCEDLTSSRRSPREFDLHYYDGLANQQEPVRLTVYPDSAVKMADAEDVDSDLTPPLELCIRTRWTDAAVSWNDSEPIL